MNADDNPEVRLAQQAARGDKDAFASLFQQHFQAVYNYAHSLCNDPAEADDLTQEAFIRAYKSLSSLGPPWNFRTWAFRITRNLFLDELRRRRPVTSLEDATLISSPLPSPESQAALNDVAGHVRRTLNALSSRNKEVLVLREIHGLSYDEIAEVLDTTQAYVKTLLARSRAEFQLSYGVQLLMDEPSEDCHEVTELLQFYHDGELVGDSEPFVREHLKSCAACQKRRNWLITESGLLAALIPVLPPADLAIRTLGRMGMAPKPGREPQQPQPESGARPARRFRPLQRMREHPWITFFGGVGVVTVFFAGLFLLIFGWFFFSDFRDTLARSTATPSGLVELASATPEFRSANEPIVAGDTATPSPTGSMLLLIDVTPTPTLTPTSQASLAMMRFGQGAFCRKGPGTAYSDVYSFSEGDQTRIDGRNQDLPRWWWVPIPGTEQHCWVSDSTGTASGPVNALRVIYFAPPTPTATPKSNKPGNTGIDFDKDGYPFGPDCNDKDPKIHPGAPETPDDKVDSNCNGDDDT